jgi:hypothetical protein
MADLDATRTRFKPGAPPADDDVAPASRWRGPLADLPACTQCLGSGLVWVCPRGHVRPADPDLDRTPHTARGKCGQKVDVVDGTVRCAAIPSLEPCGGCQPPVAHPEIHGDLDDDTGNAYHVKVHRDLQRVRVSVGNPPTKGWLNAAEAAALCKRLVGILSDLQSEGLLGDLDLGSVKIGPRRDDRVVKRTVTVPHGTATRTED